MVQSDGEIDCEAGSRVNYRVYRRASDAGANRCKDLTPALLDALSPHFESRTNLATITQRQGIRMQRIIYTLVCI